MIAALVAVPVVAQTYLGSITGEDKRSPVTAANPLSITPAIGGAVISATNPQPVQLSQGNTAASFSNPIPVALSDSSKATYAASIDYFTPYATPTDVMTIGGSASKTVKIHKIILSGTQTTAGINKWYLIKRSTADTSGTSSAATIVPLDSTSAAATGTVKKWTAAPTIAGTVGTIRTLSVLAPAPASVSSADLVLFDDMHTGQPIVLRGTAEEVALNFNGAAVPSGMSISPTVYTTEE